MPSSHFLQVNEILELIIETDPCKLLDIGIGFGKFGFLSREYLELWGEDHAYGDWRRQIDGIEAFDPYITAVQKSIYDHIYKGNALDVLPCLSGKYDLVLLIDVLEHFTYEEGLKVIEECRRISNNILIAVPEYMNPQEAVFGNQFEIHKYPWTKKDFRNIPDKFFLTVPRSLICFIGDKSRPVEQAVRKRIRKQRVKDLLDLVGLRKPVSELRRFLKSKPGHSRN